MVCSCRDRTDRVALVRIGVMEAVFRDVGKELLLIETLKCGNEWRKFVHKLLDDPEWNRVKFAGFACCVASEASYRGMIDDLELIETGGAWGVCVKDRGAADAVDERTPSFSAKAFEKASAVSSSELRGLSFFCRRTDFSCRHNFFESPLLSVIFLPQNSLCFRPHSWCFFWACVVQARRSLTSRVLRYRCSSALFLRLAAAQYASNQGVVGWWRRHAAWQGAFLSRGVRRVASYISWRSSTEAPSYSAGLHSLETQFGSKAVLVETPPRTCADIHEVDWRTWELELEDQRVIGDLAWEPDIDDRSRKIISRYHNVEGPPERVSCILWLKKSKIIHTIHNLHQFQILNTHFLASTTPIEFSSQIIGKYCAQYPACSFLEIFPSNYPQVINLKIQTVTFKNIVTRTPRLGPSTMINLMLHQWF